MALKLDFTFDTGNYRHYMEGHQTVLHCHHYMTLTTKLAEDMKDIGGTRILREVAEDSIRPLLDGYFTKHGIKDPAQRFEVGQEFYSVMGMGRLEAKGTASGGEIKLLSSHVDQGWINKWGTHDKFINHFTCGFGAALFGAVFDKPPRSYGATETTSIVVGDAVGLITVKAV